MSLALGIGELVLAAEENDPEFLDAARAKFTSLKDGLVDNGLPPHVEPEDFELPVGRCPVISFPYSWLHYLRRFAAYVLGSSPRVPAPVQPNERPSNDLKLDRMSTPKFHLLYHSDCEGFYVPIDFPEVIVDDRVPGEMVGSTYRLMDELVRIAPYLGIQLINGKLSDDAAADLSHQILNRDDDPFVTEKTVWFALFDAAEQSIQRKSAIIFG